MSKWLDNINSFVTRSKDAIFKAKDEVTSKIKQTDLNAINADADKYAGMAKDSFKKTMGMLKEQATKLTEKPKSPSSSQEEGKDEDKKE